MTITTNHTLKALMVLAWIIFIGLCVDAGGVIFNTFYTMAVNPARASNFWGYIDLSALYSYDKGHFFVVCLLIMLSLVLRAVMFYLIVQIFYSKHVKFSAPFNKHAVRFIFSIASITLMIGVICKIGIEYSEGLAAKGISLPSYEKMHLEGFDIWLFMSVTLFIIGHIFKKGVEIQTENDLTV